MVDIQAQQVGQALRTALAAEVRRVSALLRSLSDEHPASSAPPGRPSGTAVPPGRPSGTAAESGTAAPPSTPAPVLGRWHLADIAMHLSQTWIAIPGLARADLSEVEALIPGRGAGQSVARNVGQLGAVTLRAVAADPERDLGVLAGRIEARSGEFLARCAEADPTLCRPWLLSGITVPPHVFTAHLLNETVMHGADIAHAAGRPWQIDPAHAALVVRWFLFELLLNGAPELIGEPATLAALRGRYRFDIRGHGSVRMVFDADGARLDDEPGRPDCRIKVDPVAFLLMFFGRRGPLETAARGGILAWGRKPWLAMRLQRALPIP